MLAVTHTPMYGLGTPPLGLPAAAAALRADMLKYLGPIIGQDRAGGMFDKFMLAIAEQAGAGAKAKVMPILIGGLVVSGLVAAVGVGLVVAAKRKKRTS